MIPKWVRALGLLAGMGTVLLLSGENIVGSSIAVICVAQLALSLGADAGREGLM
jgi:hypothetical protein